MAKQMKSAAKSINKMAALAGALEGARRASEDGPASAAPADPEVVAIAQRRRIAPLEKRRILAAADRCTQYGELGALLRREGIYSSQLRAWRAQRAAGGLAGVGTLKRGRKADAAIAENHRNAKLTRECERLRRQLAQAHLIIEVQKKVSSLLASQTLEDADGSS